MQIHTLLSLIVLGAEALRLDDLSDGVTVGADGATVGITEGVSVTIGSDGASANIGNQDDPSYTDMGDSCWLSASPQASSHLTCPDGLNEEAGVCYEDAPSGATCVGSTCFSCSSDFNKTSLNCERKSKKYGYAAKYKCSWRGCSYKSCKSGYSRHGGWCSPNISCPSGTKGDGNYCTHIATQREMSQMECSNGGVWDPIHLSCQVPCSGDYPAEFALAPGTCLSTCPSGTAICEVVQNTGTFCIDDELDCTDYALDMTGYAIDWTVAITTQNWV